LSRKRISEIKKTDISSIHSGIIRQPAKGKFTADGKPKLKSGSTANRILDLASAVFNWGIESGLTETNPAKGVKSYSERSRDRFLQKDELPKFFEALNGESNDTIRDYILISLLTGARRANILEMRWEEISFERKEWRIPRTKNEDPQTVMLMNEVIEILNARKNNESVFVFPGSGITGHLVEPKKGWKRILKEAGINNLRLHDLRRTLGSWQAKTGASLIIIGKSLNHKSLAATQVYSRLDNDPVRESIEKATTAMLEAAAIPR
jgi:integrase